MNASSVRDQVKRRIRQAHVKPLPRWLFTLRNDAFWFLSVISIAIGGAAASLWLLLIEQEELDVYATAFHGTWEFGLLIVLPLLWVVILVLLVSLASFNARHTNRGYRWPHWQIVTGSLIGSILLGLLLHVFGWSTSFDVLLRQQIMPYRQLRELRQDFWHRPSEGMLGGTIVNVKNDKLYLRDANGNIWQVDLAGAPPLPHQMVRPGTPVRIVGILLEEGLFMAEEVRPWHGDWIRGRLPFPSPPKI